MPSYSTFLKAAAGTLRPIVPILVGASRMSSAKFILASAASSVIWAVFVLAPAYYGFKAMTH